MVRPALLNRYPGSEVRPASIPTRPMPSLTAGRRTRRLLLALGMNAALVAAQLTAGLLAGSLGLLADAGHNLADAAGIAGSLLAVRLTLRPRDEAHSFGYYRGTIIAALANSALIAAVTVAICVGAITRILHGSAPDGRVMVLVAAVATVANAGGALLLKEKAADNERAGGLRDLNMASAALHLGADAIASLVVAGAGAAILADHSLGWADPVSSLVVAALIVAEAWALSRASVRVLLESSPAGMDLERLVSAMTNVVGVAEVHDLHVWSLSSEVRAMSAHVVLSGHPSLEEANAVGQQVKDAVVGPFAIAHATLELECERCVEEPDDPCELEP